MVKPVRIGAEAALRDLPLWRAAEGSRDAIRRTLRFADFAAAFGFMTRVALAVGPFTNRVLYLEDGDYAAVDHSGALVFNQGGHPVERPIKTVASSAALMEKGNYRHFMEKEIHDQPEGCQRTIAAYVDPLDARTAVPGEVDWAALERVQIVACGTSYIAGVIGKYLIEKYADLPVDVEIASEFRYREPALRPGTLAIAMSQSGETADTLAALRYCKAKGMKSAAATAMAVRTLTWAVKALVEATPISGPQWIGHTTSTSRAMVDSCALTTTALFIPLAWQ